MRHIGTPRMQKLELWVDKKLMKQNPFGFLIEPNWRRLSFFPEGKAIFKKSDSFVFNLKEKYRIPPNGLLRQKMDGTTDTLQESACKTTKVVQPWYGWAWVSDLINTPFFEMTTDPACELPLHPARTEQYPQEKWTLRMRGHSTHPLRRFN